MGTITWISDDARFPERGAPTAGAEGVARAAHPAPVAGEEAARRAALGGVPACAEGSARIWAVGGGKGGVGKSVVTANLAVAMAGAGRRCVVIDADLGGANLHTLLGVSRPRYSLSQLLAGDVESLAELMVQTSVPNLWLVSGNKALLEMANPRHSQKAMLFRQIRELDVDDVVLDLGAGSSFNVLDFFLLARHGLVVVTPEPTAIENAEHFIRAAFYRSLREVARRPDVAAVIRRLRQNGSARRLRSGGELIALVRAVDPPAAKPLAEHAQSFAPLLLVNQARTPQERRVGARLVESCRERLGVEIELVGTIDAEPSVADAVARGQPALQAYPLCEFSRRIEAIARRLERAEPDAPRERRHEGDPDAGRAWRDASPQPRPLPPLDRDRPGDSLRRRREALGWSLSEMTERTRIRILDHIENERFDRLPPEPYLKGYLLEYARELGVDDVADFARSYLARCPAPAAAEAERDAKPAPVSRRSPFRWRG